MEGGAVCLAIYLVSSSVNTTRVTDVKNTILKLATGKKYYPACYEPVLCTVSTHIKAGYANFLSSLMAPIGLVADSRQNWRYETLWCWSSNLFAKGNGGDVWKSTLDFASEDNLPIRSCGTNIRGFLRERDTGASLGRIQVVIKLRLLESLFF